MDWSAVVGGLIGAGVPSILTWVGLRRGRQSADAEAFGPAVLLLIRIEPDRVMINANRDTDAETWSALRDQLDKAREGLLIVSAGNPRRRVRKLAQEAEVKLTSAGTWSRWAVKDLLEHRDFTESMKTAYKHHAEATAAMRELIGANFRWSPLPPRPAAAQWTDTLAAPPAPGASAPDSGAGDPRTDERAALAAWKAVQSGVQATG